MGIVLPFLSLHPSLPHCEVQYCDDWACLSVCLSIHISQQLRVQISPARLGPHLAALLLCTSGFVDDTAGPYDCVSLNTGWEISSSMGWWPVCRVPTDYKLKCCFQNCSGSAWVPLVFIFNWESLYHQWVLKERAARFHLREICKIKWARNGLCKELGIKIIRFEYTEFLDILCKFKTTIEKL